MLRLSPRDYVIDLVKVGVNNSGDVINLSSFDWEKGKEPVSKFHWGFQHGFQHGLNIRKSILTLGPYLSSLTD